MESPRGPLEGGNLELDSQVDGQGSLPPKHPHSPVSSRQADTQVIHFNQSQRSVLCAEPAQFTFRGNCLCSLRAVWIPFRCGEERWACFEPKFNDSKELGTKNENSLLSFYELTSYEFG